MIVLTFTSTLAYKINSEFVCIFQRPQQASPVGSVSSSGQQQLRPPPHFGAQPQIQQHNPNLPPVPQHQQQNPHGPHISPNSNLPPPPQHFNQGHHIPPPGIVPHHLPPPHLQTHPQSQQIGRQLPPPDQNQNIHGHQGKANSRASSSSGGNASTVHGGSIGGGTVAGNIGPSPSGAKQEQRLTHEQVIFFN